jgi:hypothetical protein
MQPVHPAETESDMLSMPIIEIAIGLVFTFVLLSILCSIINEWVANIMSLRSKNLKENVARLLSDPKMEGLSTKVLAHPLIKNATKSKVGPAYISSNTFAKVLIDILDENSNMAVKIAKDTTSLVSAIDAANLPPDVKKIINSLIDDVKNPIERLQDNLKVWFDDSMDRISGIYKRNLQKLSLCIALALAIGLNVDAIAISMTLWKNPTLRTQVADEVAVAMEKCKAAGKPGDCPQLGKVDSLRQELAHLPIGWNDPLNSAFDLWGWFVKLIGWVITALAVSLGAPFWFDVLNKLNSMRSTGVKPKSNN